MPPSAVDSFPKKMFQWLDGSSYEGTWLKDQLKNLITDKPAYYRKIAATAIFSPSQTQQVDSADSEVGPIASDTVSDKRNLLGMKSQPIREPAPYVESIAFPATMRS